jgi:hypothetical protein
MLQIHNRTTNAAEMRIQKLWPTTNWNAVWTHIYNIPIPESLKVTWYFAIHDLIPTNARLQKIWLSSSDKCKICRKVDTALHRITDCGDGQQIWELSAKKIATILRTEERYIPMIWLLRPDCEMWPPTRLRAVMWILAHTVQY